MSKTKKFMAMFMATIVAMSCTTMLSTVWAEENKEQTVELNINNEPEITTTLPIETTITTTTTTTPSTIDESEFEQIRELLTVFIEENGYDAKILSNEEYPGYQPIVIEYNAETPVGKYCMEYALASGIDLATYCHFVGTVPIQNGVAITTTLPIETTITTTTTVPLTTDVCSETTDMITAITTTDTITEITSTTGTSETETATTTTTTTTNYKNSSEEDFINWAINDYQSKTGIKPANAVLTENIDGNYEITLMDDVKNVLDVYTIDPETAIGTSQSGNEINLPQTGIYSMKNWLIFFGGVLLLGFGLIAIKKSEFIKTNK